MKYKSDFENAKKKLIDDIHSRLNPIKQKIIKKVTESANDMNDEYLEDEIKLQIKSNRFQKERFELLDEIKTIMMEVEQSVESAKKYILSKTDLRPDPNRNKEFINELQRREIREHIRTMEVMERNKYIKLYADNLVFIQALLDETQAGLISDDLLSLLRYSYAFNVLNLNLKEYLSDAKKLASVARAELRRHDGEVADAIESLGLIDPISMRERLEHFSTDPHVSAQRESVLKNDENQRQAAERQLEIEPDSGGDIDE